MALLNLPRPCFVDDNLLILCWLINLARSMRESTNHTQGIFRGLTVVARFVRVSVVGLLMWSEAAILIATNNSHPRYRVRFLRPAALLLTSDEIQMPDRHCLHSECLDGM